MTEWGVSNDEGLLEGPFYSPEAAQAAAAELDSDEQAWAGQLCGEHREQEAFACEDCLEDEL